MVQGLNLQKAAIPPANDQPAPDQNERNSKRPRLWKMDVPSLCLFPLQKLFV